MAVRIEALEPRQLLAGTPDAAGVPDVAASVDRLVFSGVQHAVTREQRVTLRNVGSVPLSVASVTVAGDAAADFVLLNRRVPAALKPGASVRLKVVFKPPAAGVFGAELRVASDDPDAPVLSVGLRGLGTAGRFEPFEPSLQRVLDTFQVPVLVGDADVATTSALDGPAPTDELVMPLLAKAGPGPVRVSALAAYSWEWKPIVGQLGWYEPGGRPKLHKLVKIRPGSAQTVWPRTAGRTSFDPKGRTFGLFGQWPSEQHAPSFSQDGLNTWDRTDDDGRKVRFYPYRTPDGRAVADTYVVAMEQAFNSDFQDAVLVIENVRPAT